MLWTRQPDAVSWLCCFSEFGLNSHPPRAPVSVEKDWLIPTLITAENIRGNGEKHAPDLGSGLLALLNKGQHVPGHLMVSEHPRSAY